MRKASDRYLKVVEWSEADETYIGTCLGVFHGSIHGDDQAKVFADLVDLVDEHLRQLEAEGGPLPAPTAGWVAYNLDETVAFAEKKAQGGVWAAA